MFLKKHQYHRIKNRDLRFLLLAIIILWVPSGAMQAQSRLMRNNFWGKKKIATQIFRGLKTPIKIVIANRLLGHWNQMFLTFIILTPNTLIVCRSNKKVQYQAQALMHLGVKLLFLSTVLWANYLLFEKLLLSGTQMGQ